MRSKESPAISTVLFSLLIFLCIASPTGARKSPKICTSSCGDNKNISYPFRLQSDPRGCGDPAYELHCENNKTILNFYGGRYYVKSISYKERLMRVVDVNLADGNCSLPYKLTPSDVFTDDRYLGLSSYKYASFVRCSNRIIGLSEYKRVSCLSQNSSYVYVFYSDGILYDLPWSCKVVSMVPTALDAKSKNPSTDETILKLLQSGFDLGWSIECWKCTADHHYCSIISDPEQQPHIYKCQRNEEYYDYLETLAWIYSWLTLNSLLGLVFFTRFILCPLVLFAFLLHKYITPRKAMHNEEEFSLDKQLPLKPERYSYTDIMSITNNFRDKIGEGSFGSVYKGKLPAGHFVAVKLLEKISEEKVVCEISAISRIRHVNVAQVVGFCAEGSKCALVYEYMPNGALDRHIFSDGGNVPSLSWKKIHEIALGMARGIEFLHRGSDVCIIHLDIKPQNILLDQNMIPKISDFCLAKLYPKKYDFVSSCTRTGRGTTTYMAPEFISRAFGAVSCKSDVYSFGMLLMEMASRRRCIDVEAIYPTKVYFPSWVYDQLHEKPGLMPENISRVEATMARKLLIIGLCCTQTRAADRPSMTRVVQMLQGSIENLEMPPKSALVFAQSMPLKQIQSDDLKELLIPELVERSA